MLCATGLKSRNLIRQIVTIMACFFSFSLKKKEIE